jgi:hypothetical protein
VSIDPEALLYEVPADNPTPNPYNAREVAYQRWLETGQTEPDAEAIDPWPPEPE